MRCYLKFIAVIDKSNVVHHVAFGPGVNVITGKSSTGKSAMIEIFDYCFGNSDYTVPEGIITDRAQLYFIVLTINSTDLVLARKPGENRVFIKEEPNDDTISDINMFHIGYFESNNFITLSDFLLELGRCFGIDILDTDENLERKEIRGKKAPRPSPRNFTSFMLQHQNLVANKHSLFYRFDEKEKREQTIDQFKIFNGFVDQAYFLKMQKLNKLEKELKVLKVEQEKTKKHRETIAVKLNEFLREYHAVTGKRLIQENTQALLRHPNKYLKEIQSHKIEPDYESDENIKQRERLEKEKNQLTAEIRELQVKQSNISSSIEYAKQYKSKAENIAIIEQVDIHLSKCPFCNTQNKNISNEANRLEEAITWLNSELTKTPYLLDSFLSDKNKIDNKIAGLKDRLFSVSKEVGKVDIIVEKLKKNKTLEEQGLKIKYRIESFLEDILDENTNDIEKNISGKKDELKSLIIELKENYDVASKIKEAENFINEGMNQIGNYFDFESSYKPINLKFSLNSFDLWHVKNNKGKIFLRSMGSGANWLYCHLTLFMSLHRYFCYLGDKCMIPPILFFDQPSQVYFPSTIDIKEVFDPQELKKQEGKQGQVDEDIKAVTVLYNQLVNYCNDTEKETGIRPQIIVTDHADNLKLENNINFEDLVAGRRWRKRGFIKV